jgi:hypothetical protein
VGAAGMHADLGVRLVECREFLTVGDRRAQPLPSTSADQWVVPLTVDERPA